VRHDFEPVDVGNEDASAGVAVQVFTDHEGGRHAAFVPAGLGRLGPEGLSMMVDLQRVVLKIREAQDHLAALVIEARDMGMSWDSVGWCVGTAG
jgi:hypothetical protein